MVFSNLKSEIFLELKSMSQQCYYSLSAKHKCWKFMFNDEFGIALIKHEDFTCDDKWSVVGIRRIDKTYEAIDDPWLNVSFGTIFEYANLIKELYLCGDAY